MENLTRKRPVEGFVLKNWYNFWDIFFSSLVNVVTQKPSLSSSQRNYLNRRILHYIRTLYYHFFL